MNKEKNNLVNTRTRAFKMSDYDAVMELWQRCELPYKPNGRDRQDKIEREITRDTSIFLVAEKDDQIIGTVLATHDGRRGWINRLAVAENFRHRGLAQRLLKEAEVALYQIGIEIVTCLIEDYNQTSMDFFQKAGYIKHTDIIYFSKRKYPQV